MKTAFSLFKKTLPRLLIVDDEPINLRVLQQVLQAHYRLSFARSGADALALVEHEDIDLILLDVMMPNMTGFEVCQQLKANPATGRIPIIFVTALRDSIDEEQGFEIGAVDYIVKPIVPAIVKARVKTHLSLVQVELLRETQVDLIQRLGRVAEFKDNETGLHIHRMSHYVYLLAIAAGVDSEMAEAMQLAAPMHDIGKVAIPDAILQKRGKLDEAELQLMQRHAELGAALLANPRSALIDLARSIAHSHHEKWDGTGYPQGLQGEAIPLEGRIVAIADVFDALTSERPYKRAWPVDDAVNYLREQAGKHFDPELVALFILQLPEVLAIQTQFAETGVFEPLY